MTRQIFILSLMLSPLLLQNSAIHPVDDHGTLVTVLPSIDGTVVCADQREWNSVEGPKDGVRKIHLLGKRAAYAISGESSISIIEAGKLVVRYSVADSVQHFFSDPRNSKLSLQVLQRFATTFSGEFREAHRRYNSKIQLPPDTTDDVVTELDFAYLDPHGSVIVDRFEYHITGKSTIEDSSGTPFVTGQTGVALRILRPREPYDARFSDLWGDQRIARVWLQGTSKYPTQPSVNDALYFAHTFIRATNERAKYLSNGPSMVGQTCDCAIIQPKAGVRWLEHSFDVRQD